MFVTCLDPKKKCRGDHFLHIGKENSIAFHVPQTAHELSDFDMGKTGGYASVW